MGFAPSGIRKLPIRFLSQGGVSFGIDAIDTRLRHARKMWALVAVLILNRGASVPTEELVEAIAGKSTHARDFNALRVMVHRIRELFAKEDPAYRNIILSTEKGYGWNMSLTGEVDVFAMEALCEEILSMDQEAGGLKEKLAQLLRLYQREILKVYKAEWAQKSRQKLHYKYIDAIDHGVKTLWLQTNFEAIVQIYQQALWVGPQVEAWERNQKEAMVKMGIPAQSMEKGKWEASGKSVEAMAEALLLGDSAKGPTVCGMDLLPTIYQAQRRALARMDVPVHLAVVSLAVRDGTNAPLAKEGQIKGLEKVLRDNLRACDTVTLCAGNKYMLLLQGHEPMLALNRVRNQIYKEMGSYYELTCYLKIVTLPGGNAAMGTG